MAVTVLPHSYGYGAKYMFPYSESAVVAFSKAPELGITE
jgi:hypothetical protein